MNKVNGKIWKFLAILVGVFFAIIGVVYAYGALNRDVEHNTKEIARHDIRIEKNEDAGSERDKAIIEQRSDLKHIKEAVDRIEKKL